MRFDDSLDTVLAAEMSSPAAIEWTWRQLVDLIGRRRSAARADAITRLQSIRSAVPLATRIAAARGLERAHPPAVLVALFADDEQAVAAPVVRSATLADAEWIVLLPAMRPATRGVMRLRRDLSDAVRVALEAFGPTDFTLGSDVPAATEPAEAAPPPTTVILPRPAPKPFVPPEPNPFVTVADIARELPIVAEAMRRDDDAPSGPPPVAEDFQVAALVARIAARRMGGPPVMPAREAAAPATGFRYETDAAGRIRWVEGIDRTPLIGLSLTAGRDGTPASVDGVAAGALARRARFRDARLEVTGQSGAAGSWRISGMPAFDPASGRFTGYRGTARRPRADEAPERGAAPGATDMLRQLVHELRTPANAISGFAEMIERELLGPVPPAYRERAGTIHSQTLGLLEAIEDLDTAARLEARRLDLYPEPVPLSPLLARTLGELDPLATLRGTTLRLEVTPDLVVHGDARALERLVSRFLTFVLAGAAQGQAIAGRATRDGDVVGLTVDRPAALAVPGEGLFATDDHEAADDGGPLLGTGFGFRLARRLASELGGSLTVEAARLTLRLPAAVAVRGEQATV